MEYITAYEAAEKWGVTPRQVQRLLAAERIPGARKQGRDYRIPADAEKPGDLRCEKHHPQDSLAAELAEIFEATALPMPRDNPDAIFGMVKEERLRLPYECELAYLRGDFELVKQIYKTRGDEAIRVRITPTAMAAAISAGDFPFFLEVENHLKSVMQKRSEDKNVIAIAELFLSSAYISAMVLDNTPDWLKTGDFTYLPNRARPYAAHMRAKYFHAVGEFESMLNVAETALAFCDFTGGIYVADIYLRVMCATACCLLGRVDEATRWLLGAMRITLPHGFITPFADCASVFGGLLEKLLEREYPAHYGAIINLWKRAGANWVFFHNFVTKNNFVFGLPLRDYEIAIRVAKGVPNKEIAEHFHMSQGRLRNKISEIYSELHVNSRKELERFLLYGKKQT